MQDSSVVPNVEDLRLQQQQKSEYEERREMILDQILEAPARERLRRLTLVKPDKARAAEDSLIKGATNGHFKSKVNEELLIKLLEQFGGSEIVGGAKKAVTIQRRKYGIDDEDDDDDDSDLL